MSTVRGLSADQTQRLQDAVRQRESGGNYQIENKYGYIGGYQFGAEALQSQGLIKPGITTSYASLGAEGQKALLNNPDNWTIPGGKQAFLNNPELQDQAFNKLANQNYSYLSKKGVIDGDTPPGDVAGYLTAAHLKGAGNAAKLANGTITRDANGTPTSEYFALGKGAVNGTASGPTASGKKTGSVASGKTPSISPTTKGGFSIATGGRRYRDPAPILGIQTNTLERFVSFNCIFTLSCISDRQVNFPDAPDSYKSGNLGEIILRGGSGLPDNRVPTAYTSESNPTGKFEYYIDNVQIESVMSYNKRSKGTNATNITFDIYEPYSMGIFLQSMQLAAVKQGYKNYIDAPFLLTLQFIGRDANGDVVPVDDVLDRHIPLKLANTSMSVTASGCMYAVEAYPYNEQGFSDSQNMLKEDVSISGKTVAELLQTGPTSLQAYLNRRLEEQAKQGSETGQETYTRDEIVILFPTTENLVSSNTASGEEKESGSSATVNPGDAPKNRAIETKLSINRGNNNILSQVPASLNPIGKAEMGFDQNTGGDVAPATEQSGKTPVSRTNIKIDHANRSFRFPQGTTIVNAISEVVVMSKYAKEAVKAKPDDKGFKPWFRVECRVYNLEADAGNVKKGRTPKLYVYNVVEYDVHQSRFLASTSEAKGIDELKRAVVKEYNYIYSGKNVDVINFNLKFDASMFTTVYTDKLALANSVYGQLNGTGLEKSTNQPTSNLDAAPSNYGVQGVAREGDLHKKETTVGGGPSEGYEELVAKQFQEAILNSESDMITAEMEILGDPYYIADSGMGNFGDKLAAYNITKSGAMDYQSGEVDVLVNFRTPIDYNPATGYMDFGNTAKVDSFSGLYFITTVKSSFVKGKFTQILDMNRRRNQTVEDPPVQTGPEAAKDVKDAGAPATVSASQPNVKHRATDSKAQGEGQETNSTVAKPSDVPGGP